MSNANLISLACVLTLSCACSSAGNRPAEANHAEPNAPPMAEDGHSSRNSLDWAGTYSGVVPCADCPGIRMTVTLRDDGTFERTLVYLERSVEPLVETGRFSWNAAGSSVRLEEPGGGRSLYKVGENTLTPQGREDNPMPDDVASRFVLHKHLHDPAIEGWKWMLTELRGKPVPADTLRKPFLVLDAETSVASGNSSCNSFSGRYAIKSGHRLRFADNMVATRMACPDMSIEQAFFDVLRAVESYAVADGMLRLSDAGTATLARFEASGK